MKNKEYFDKAISTLNKMGIKNEDIIVTGSIALDIYGLLPETHTLHDFDCIVNIKPEIANMIKFASNMFKTDKCPSECGDNTAILEVNGIVLNIWWNAPNEIASVKFEGVGVKDIMSILEMKKKYKRDKDYKDIIEIAKMILN